MRAGVCVRVDHCNSGYMTIEQRRLQHAVCRCTRLLRAMCLDAQVKLPSNESFTSIPTKLYGNEVVDCNYNIRDSGAAPQVSARGVDVCSSTTVSVLVVDICSSTTVAVVVVFDTWSCDAQGKCKKRVTGPCSARNVSQDHVSTTTTTATVVLLQMSTTATPFYYYCNCYYCYYCCDYYVLLLLCTTRRHHIISMHIISYNIAPRASCRCSCSLLVLLHFVAAFFMRVLCSGGSPTLVSYFI